MAGALLIDGNSLMYRAFFALPPLTSPDGTPTNALYGFLSMFLRAVADEQPEYAAVAFDVHGPTFRHLRFADYKGDCIDGSVSHNEIVCYLTRRKKKKIVVDFYLKLCSELKEKGY